MSLAASFAALCSFPLCFLHEDTDLLLVVLSSSISPQHGPSSAYFSDWREVGEVEPRPTASYTSICPRRRADLLSEHFLDLGNGVLAENMEAVWPCDQTIVVEFPSEELFYQNLFFLHVLGMQQAKQNPSRKQCRTLSLGRITLFLAGSTFFLRTSLQQLSPT